jgi:acyl carrier protein
MYAIHEIVRLTLAAHLRVDPRTITADSRLAADLHLQRIDVIWIAMRVEALELGRSEFPIEKLDDVVTVADLVTAFEDWAAERDTFEDIDVYIADEDPAPSYRKSSPPASNDALLKYVREELRRYLRCGDFAQGFGRASHRHHSLTNVPA